MDFFKQKTNDTPVDVKMIRDGLLQFIKDKLGQAEGGEGNNIKGIHLYFNCDESERHLYESAVYFEEADRFKTQDVQKIADDFAIELPAAWTMSMNFVDELPPQATRAPRLHVGIFIETRKNPIPKQAVAYLKVLNGEAEKEYYTINSTDGKINIGREKKVQGADGFFRMNAIAFSGQSQNESNKFISRQHAHIQYEPDTGQFILYADEGGIPPRNKVKVLSSRSSQPIKLYSSQIGHALEEGDQIMLGESAIIAFSYVNENAD